MYGTIAIAKPKAGQEQALVNMLDQWWEERRPKIRGAVASTIYRNTENPAELMIAVVFDSKESYMANAEDPEQDRFYRQMLELLEGEPRWIDGDVLAHKHV